MQQVGVRAAVRYAQRLGIESQLPMVPSLALGTGEVTLLELTAAYGAFANRGVLASPRLITRVEDAQGTPIYYASEHHSRAIRPSTAFLMSSMLADVITSGTGAPARATGFKLPAAGKTGTTDDYADAWFVGYTPRLVAGVWFGLDQPAPIMRGGFAGVVAAPAWGRFMRAATAADKAAWYETPSDVEKVAICRRSGARATDACRHAADIYPASAERAAEAAQHVGAVDDSWQPRVAPTNDEPPVYEDLFAAGAVPGELCPVHTGAMSDAAVMAWAPVSNYRATASSVESPQGNGSSSPAAASTVTAPSSGIVLERVLGPDGILRVVMRNRRQ
jgi:membrane peptidoglycan carboxypeptidase